MTQFPAGTRYFIAASRLRPGLDGGYTVATLRRALEFASHGGVQPTLLTYDFWPEYPAIRDEFAALGLATADTDLRNLYQDARLDAAFLRSAATPSVAREVPAGLTLAQDVDSAGRPWRVTASDASGTPVHTDFLDLQGRPVLRLPYVSGRADWHLAPVPIEVFDESGNAIIGVLDGFGALYRAWTASIVPSGSVVVVEARQVGELIGSGPRDFTLVHTVHNAHTSPPYAWDSPMDLLWTNWFASVDQYDAVIWLTEAQRDDAVRRFGEHSNWVVIPHPAAALEELPPVSRRDPNRIVMVSRLADQKRVDHAINAWPAILAEHPDARLEVYGGGVLRPQLEELIDSLGLGASVTLHGHVADVAAQLETAAALLLTSRYEGHPLVVAEAFSRGCPVIAYDLSYGPREMVEHGINGYLVPTGSVEGIAEAVSRVLGDPALIAELSRGAWDWARTHGAELAMQRTAELLAALGIGSGD